MGAGAVKYRDAAAGGTALVAAAAAVIVPVGPAMPRPSAPPIVSRAVQLVVDGASVLNIPINLFAAIVNIPGTEVQALNTLAGSLFFAGPWFAASATNIWGEDPGDPGHFMSLIDVLIPVKEISGLDSPEIDPVANGVATLADLAGFEPAF
ncbi:MAG TPA: hypothetical protein VFR27_00655 [Mycobacterium sp.]|nr:hypothetical protein [Mycobacterium sp.]